MSERDKYLTEAMGKCWHEATEDHDSISPRGYYYGVCSCGVSSDDHHGRKRLPLKGYEFNYPAARDEFSTWPGFGVLWEWAQDQDWLEEFCSDWCGLGYAIIIRHVHPDRFANAVYEFLKGREV